MQERNRNRLNKILNSSTLLYEHPERSFLPSQYKLNRGLAQYIFEIPGLEKNLKDSCIWIDSGAGSAKATYEFATKEPNTKVFAISNNSYLDDYLPDNLEYLVGNVFDILPKINSADIITDLYGPFTYLPKNQMDLIKLYHQKLHKGGKAWIRFDGDHVGVIKLNGEICLLGDYIMQSNNNDINIIKGPNPTGPTALVHIMVIEKKSNILKTPSIKLISLKQYPDDIVPFVMYREIKSNKVCSVY